MATIPSLSEIPGIRRRLRFYQVTANITGVLLLLLCAEMILRYAFHIQIELFGPFGFVAFVQDGMVTAFNLSRWILIIHGWFYVIYLIACYLVWQKMRWELVWLLAMAAGGVVPFLSFITEYFMTKRTNRHLAEIEARWLEYETESGRLADFEASLSDEERAELDRQIEAEVRRRSDGE